RREEVLARLAGCGLARGPRRVEGAADGEGGGRAARLRAALAGLGPVFCSFGLYLATRVDLLRAGDCLELAAVPDRAPTAPPAAARELFRREVGCDPGEAFAHFEDEPFESGLFHQSHRALGADGAPVVVKLIRPGSERLFMRDVELLPLLEGAAEGLTPGGAAFRSAAADFVSALRRQLDFAHEAKAHEALAREAEEFEMLRAPAVRRDLSTTRVLTVEEVAGTRLSDAAFPADGRRTHRGLPGVGDPAGLARLLCTVWLRLALSGQVFPVEPHLGNVVAVSDRQVAFTGGLFAGLPAESQSNLWRYMLAAAGEEPDRACACLVREVRRAGPPGAEEDLRHLFRQVVPFRDSEWHRDDDVNRLLEHLVVHWRAASGCGYVPQPHLPSFYRGLFMVAGVAQRLAPDGDPLLEGLQDARLLASLGRVRELMSLQQMGDQFDKYAAMMMGMPGRLDEMLTLGEEGGARVRLRVTETPSDRRQKNSSAAVTSLLLVLASAALLLPPLTASLLAREWADRVNAVVFILVGVMVLRAASRA
ncbi:MAG TPA: AarF/UbiB family protein, partial [Pyrinomonadaceae bacterium]